jgi:hypothetical protein
LWSCLLGLQPSGVLLFVAKEPVMTELIKLGWEGEAVATAQRLLNFHFAPLPPLAELGKFGPETDQRVRRFQRLSFLDDDGIVGPLTTRALLPIATLTLDGAVGTAASLSSWSPLQQWFPNRPRIFPRHRPRFGGVFAPPEWLSRRSPRTEWELDSVALSFGNELDVPKVADSAPLQFGIEFAYLQRGRNPLGALGATLSLTPASEDGLWAGMLYAKLGAADWPWGAHNSKWLKRIGVLSLFNPSVQLYVKKATQGPWNAGLAIGNEMDVDIVRRQGRYALQLYFNVVPLMLDLFDFDEHRFKVKPATAFGLGFKFITFTGR